MSMKNRHDLTAGPVPTLVRRVAIPASVGFFFNTMYNVVDTYFAGTISTEALAALSLSFPLFFLISSLGSGLGTGATALIGAALGSGDKDEASLLAVQGLSFGLIISFAVTAGGILISGPVFKLMGAAGAELDAGLTYMHTIFAGASLFMCVYMCNAVLQAVGDTRIFRNFLVCAFFLNCVLDPWFIRGGFGLPAMGVRGVAVATVLIHAIGAVYLGVMATRCGVLRLRRIRDLIPDLRCYMDIARQGIPASVNFMTIAMGVFVILWYVGQFGTAAKAAYGAAMRVEQMVLVPTIGLNIAVLSISAQNYGAGHMDRVRETLHTALRYGAWLMGAGTLIVFFLSPQMMTIFSDDPDVVRIGRDYLRVDALVLYAYVVLFASTAALQGVKRPMFAIWIGLWRQIVAPAAVMWVLVFTLGWGLWGVWWGIFAVTWSSAAVAFWWAKRTLGRIESSKATD